jgi:hypothetical protein
VRVHENVINARREAKAAKNGSKTYVSRVNPTDVLSIAESAGAYH